VEGSAAAVRQLEHGVQTVSQLGGEGWRFIGKSKGGWTTEILALTDALGNLVRLERSPGSVAVTASDGLLPSLPPPTIWCGFPR
jgi:hypothetical protein